MKIGGERRTTAEAVRRFERARMEAGARPSPCDAAAPPRSRRASIKRAYRVLAQAGMA